MASAALRDGAAEVLVGQRGPEDDEGLSNMAAEVVGNGGAETRTERLGHLRHPSRRRGWLLPRGETEDWRCLSGGGTRGIPCEYSSTCRPQREHAFFEAQLRRIHEFRTPLRPFLPDYSLPPLPRESRFLPDAIKVTATTTTPCGGTERGEIAIMIHVHRSIVGCHLMYEQADELQILLKYMDRDPSGAILMYRRLRSAASLSLLTAWTDTVQSGEKIQVEKTKPTDGVFV